VRKLWPLLLTSAIGIAILCCLGTWQVFRLAEKTKLIAQLETRMDAPAITLADAMSRQAKGENIEYVTVFARGHADTSRAIPKMTVYEGKPAWEIIEPFISEDGIFVLVDAGASFETKVAGNNTDSITGIVRLHNKGRGFFDPMNEPGSDAWYWWDLPEMRDVTAGPYPDQGTSVLETSKIAPFVLQRLPTLKDVGPPFAQAPKVELSNNHLGYAITWFGLAAALMAVAGFFARSLVLDRGKRQG
jgi:surfeit locus 1 family protein